MSLKFYEEERERWPLLGSMPISDEWARKALTRLTRHFKLDRLRYGRSAVSLTFKGRNVSWGGPNGITLAKERDWLIFCHEVAHVWEYRKHGETNHTKRLMGYLDQVCAYVIEKGWPALDNAAALEHERLQKETDNYLKEMSNE